MKQEPPLPVAVELARGRAADVEPRRARSATGCASVLVVQTRVELVPWGSLPRSDYKSKLVEH